ncbi:MAG: hypothetical protein V4611_03580 [Patescibacteria group bacterium]
MEYDPPRLIPTETTSDTPELDQECFVLKEAIDTHVDTWFELTGEENQIKVGLLSKIIIAQCAPLEKPAEDMITAIQFKGNHTKQEMNLYKRLIRNQNRLSEVAHNPLLDDTPIDSPMMARSFQFVRMTMENPNSNPMLVEALHYLHRLYVTREEIARIEGKKGIFHDAYKFSHILKKIIDEN